MSVQDDWKVQTSDIDAEQFVIGACFGSPQAVEECIEVIEPNDFYRPAHQQIFGAMVAMMLADEPITPLTVRAWMERDGDRTDRDYLLELYTNRAAPVMAKAHARIVWECSIRRRVEETGRRMMQRSLDPTQEPAEILRQAMEQLDGIAPARCRALPLNEFLALEPPRRLPVIEGFLEHEDRVVVVAGEGSGKTELAYQVGFGLAAGVHPLAFYPIPAGRVLLIDFENPLRNLQRRTSNLRDIAERSPRWDAGNVAIFARSGGIDLTRAEDCFELAEMIRSFKPDLIAGGPVYKMFEETGEDRSRHAAIARFFDKMRQRHGCAVWLETHAPIGMEKGRRALRPEGSGIWTKWPEFGIALAPDGKVPGAMLVGRFRGDRELGRAWPEAIERNRNARPCWPWTGRFPPGTFDNELL